LKYFLDLHIKGFINLKIFDAIFGIGGGNCPYCHPWLRACTWLPNIPEIASPLT